MKYNFQYNVPDTNNKYGTNDLMIDVTATLHRVSGTTPFITLKVNSWSALCGDKRMEFDGMNLTLAERVLNWAVAVKQMQSLAQTEFEMMNAVTVAEQYANTSAA